MKYLHSLSVYIKKQGVIVALRKAYISSFHNEQEERDIGGTTYDF
jgi:hypothetical protein